MLYSKPPEFLFAVVKFSLEYDETQTTESQ
jgi:hypothetical protein